jgi:hypothetical protein
MSQTATAHEPLHAAAIEPQFKAVIVRASAAGVHFGYLKSRTNDSVELVRARRLWRWFARENGSLSAVAVHGIDITKSNIGDPVTITIIGACEIIDVTPAAIETIEAGKWHR